MKVLITGFEPFRKNEKYRYKENPAEKLIKALNRNPITNVDLKLEVLPVSYKRAKKKLKEMLNDSKPDYLVMFGYYPEAMSFEIERVAINEKGTSQNGKSPLVDNDGKSPRGKISNGPESYEATFPVHELKEAFDKYKIPYKESTWPGTFVCNHCFYNALREIEQKSLQTQVAFIHIPSFRKILAYPEGARARISVDQVIKSLQHVFSSLQQ